MPEPEHQAGERERVADLEHQVGERDRVAGPECQVSSQEPASSQERLQRARERVPGQEGQVGAQDWESEPDWVPEPEPESELESDWVVGVSGAAVEGKAAWKVSPARHHRDELWHTRRSYRSGGSANHHPAPGI